MTQPRVDSLALTEQRRTLPLLYGDIRSHHTLFNDERYQRCRLNADDTFFRYDHFTGTRLVGTVAGVASNGVLECGHGAPFGGIDFVRKREQLDVVIDLLKGLWKDLSAKGIKELKIRARPNYFGENESAVAFGLLNIGAHIESCELSLGIRVDQFDQVEQYFSSLSDSARNMIRQALKVEMAFEPAVTVSEWQSCFDLLVEVRRRRGAAFKLSFEYLMKLRELFGHRLVMHRLLHGANLASTALVYRVAPQWDYVVSWGDEIQYRRYRVMNLMAYHIVQLAILERVTVIDMGISSVDGVPDNNLIQFKRSIGGTAALRTNFCLTIR